MKLTLIALTLLMSWAAGAAEYWLTEAVTDPVENKKMWDAYCNADGDVSADSIEIPKVNYSSPLVMEAVAKLDQVSPSSFYLYYYPIRLYGFSKEINPNTKMDKGDASNFDYQFKSSGQKKPKSVKNGNTHAFLTYLCGEFRDRPAMIEEKLKWSANINKLSVEPQKQFVINKKDAKGNPESIWMQMTAESYKPYIRLSAAVFRDKESNSNVHNKLTIVGKKTYKVDAPVPAFTVCETEFMLSEYVGKGKDYDGFAAFNSAYDVHKEKYCMDGGKEIEAKLGFYYDFRGDSNYKPNSPESNGMIWHANTILKGCKREGSTIVASQKYKDSGFYTDEDCENYAKWPFNSRYTAARAGLATWLARNERFDPIFSADGVSLVIVPHTFPEKLPFGFRGDGEEFLGQLLGQFLDSWESNFEDVWATPSIGMVYALEHDGSQYQKKGLAYERLRDAVNRHTDWYSSGYNDQINGQKDQAYSPFVASSYEMSESDAFTACGFTVQCPDDSRKRWMFVFKISKQNWFNSQSLVDGVELDFEKHWLDETSLGTNSLAKKEKAFDKLGTALEGEFDSVLYLHNIKRDGSISEDYSEANGWEYQ